MLRPPVLSSLLAFLTATACVEPTLSQDPDRSPLTLATSSQARPSDAVLLDVDADGNAIWGRPRPAPPRATVLPLFEAWLATPDGRITALPADGNAVRDARFGPARTSWIALIDRDHALWLWNPHSDERVAVAADGFPGASFSADGSALVYAAGPRPELELYVFELGARTNRQVTNLGAPLALPAFDQHGRAIVFASAFRGVPALWTVGVDGTGLRQLTNRAITPDDFRSGNLDLPMPEGRRPPLWRANGVVFEAAGNVFSVGLDGELQWALANADTPHLSRDGRLWVRTAEGARAVNGTLP